MEDSGGDSETFQKFKRLAETKKSELAYKYNPWENKMFYNIWLWVFSLLQGRGFK